MQSINRQWLLVASCVLTLAACQSHSPKNAPHEPQDSIETSADEWQDYQARSQHWREVDRDFIRAEVAAQGLDEPKKPRATNRFGFDPDRPTEWYATEEGQRVADIILSFQTPSGGWSKRTDMGHKPRQTGQAFGVESGYIPTFDNSATTTQITVLARAHAATDDRRYLEGYIRAVELLLEAQYPNGGWPQTYPLRGGYHDYITYNDEVVENNLSVLYRLGNGLAPFGSAPPALRRQALDSLGRGLELVVASQVTVNGTPTLWGGQHDPQTLEPRKARAYEMVALATSESVSLLDSLMDLEEPSEAIQHSIHSAMAWYEANKILGYDWDTDAREIVPDEDAPPLWSRFAEIGTNRPLFGDRDHSVHYDIEDISMERREGYAWYTTSPNRALEKYERWRQRFPR